VLCGLSVVFTYSVGIVCACTSEMRGVLMQCRGLCMRCLVRDVCMQHRGAWCVHAVQRCVVSACNAGCVVCTCSASMRGVRMQCRDA
jgi:hypothetical protein